MLFIASGVIGKPVVPALLKLLASKKCPPQPDTYTFSHLSTRNAIGEILGVADPEPKQ